MDADVDVDVDVERAIEDLEVEGVNVEGIVEVDV